MDPDRDLVERAKTGDMEAFGQLVEKYQHRLVNYLSALVPGGNDAEDMAQDAFLRAFKGLKGFRGTSAFRTWLYQIATNVAHTERDRRRTRFTRETQPAPGPDGAAGDLDALPGTGDLASAVVLRDRIDRALAALPAELRETVVLRDVEGFEYREIAAALDIPIGTVESRIFRARERLRAALRTG